MSTSTVCLDGTTLEGGGQLLRLALSLSSLTHIPIRVTDIRGKRGPLSAPTQGGGLKGSHLSAVRWLACTTDALMSGAEIKSRELAFAPSKGSRDAAESKATTFSKDAIKKAKTAGEILWQDRYDGDTLIRKESFIPASTPGSIFLVLQALLPYILFTAPLDEQKPGCAQSEDPKPIVHRLIIEGGTNVSKSPSYEYVDQVLLPMLRKVGIPPIKMSMDERGWTHGRSEIGRVAFDITPLPMGSTLPSFSLTKKGEVIRFYVSILAPDPTSRETIRQRSTERILKYYPYVDIEFPVDEDSKHPKRLYLHLAAETSEGVRFGRDWLYDKKATEYSAPQKCEQLVNRVFNNLCEELSHGGCVDEYMQDQLVVFQALAEGRSEVKYGEGVGHGPSLHAQTARWVTEQILGTKFDGRGVCNGVALRVGEKFWERNQKADEVLAEGVGKLGISE